MTDYKRPLPVKFVAEREKLHEKRAAEAMKGFDLMIELVKVTNGAVSSRIIENNFRRWGMTYPSTLYPVARERAGVSLRKPITRSHSAQLKLKREAREAFDLLMRTTPAEKLPGHSDPSEPEPESAPTESAPPDNVTPLPKPAVVPPLPEDAPLPKGEPLPSLPDPKTLPVEYLARCHLELLRRAAEANKVLAFVKELRGDQPTQG